jgi:molybdate-binding protein
MARWEMGLLCRGEDHRRFRSAADVAAPGVRLVAREKGAGARHFLERALRAAGLGGSVVQGATLTVTEHLDVARAIAMGAADVGVATRDAALAHDLRFVPLTEERYDLVIPRSLLAEVRVERLLDALVSRANRQELASLGYDMASAGARVAEVEAA